MSCSFENCSVDGVVRACYVVDDEGEEETLCDCSTWYGWVGETCDEPTSTVYYLRVASSFFLLWEVLLLLWLILTLCNYLYQRSPKLK